MPEPRGGSAPLPALSLRELRLLASRLGLGRYASLTRDSLVEAIRRRIGVEMPEPQAIGPRTTPAQAAAAELAPEPSLLNASGPTAPAASDTGGATATGPGSWIAFEPQDDRWAQVRWQISQADRERARAAGATDLCLRLGDITDLNDGEVLPHALQEVVVESGLSQWYLPIPVAGRSYRVELGFRGSGPSGWISLAVSAGAHVQASPGEQPAAPVELPFLLEPAPAPLPAGQQPAADSAPHELMYQTAAGGWRQQRLGSEAFQERDQAAAAAADSAAALHDSGAGVWASGRNDSGVAAVPARRRRFWLVADAELIVHAATEPSAQLTIGDAPQPLSEQGTIRIHVPFPDGEQHYPIAAVAADGEQRRNITLSFRRGTPQARVNRPEEAVDEWF